MVAGRQQQRVRDCRGEQQLEWRTLRALHSARQVQLSPRRRATRRAHRREHLAGARHTLQLTNKSFMYIII